jgi:hypothetical protein
MQNTELIREWDSDAFHQRVMELESKGYTPREGTYRITPEMNPETGAIVHLHAIEMIKQEQAEERE